MNKKILNLGCGNEVYGTERVDFVKTEATTKVCDLNDKLPFKSGFFDEVYCNSVLEHIENVGGFIKEAMRVLKKGGKFFFRTDNARYIGFILRDHQDYIKYGYASNEDRHYYLFQEDHLKSLFRKGEDLEISFTCPSWKLFFLPKRFKCMHIEVRGEIC